jgi:hypothetical protein
MATLAPPHFWDQVEPPSCEQEEGRAFHPCYSKQLRADLAPGTFVLLDATTNTHGSGAVVARIVKTVGKTPPFSIEVNIFEDFNEFGAREGILCPHGVSENHLKHLPEVVQTTEVWVVDTTHVSNLAFVFTEASLQDASNMYFTCQGMRNAFILRYRLNVPSEEDSDLNDSRRRSLSKVPFDFCLPFPSCYQNSKYPDCYARRVWNNLLLVKLEITKLLGRYSQQQGLYGRECARLYFTAETWAFLCLQCTNLFSASDFRASKRIRLHRVIESGLVVKATRVQKSCVLLRFATKTELQGLCGILGESVTAGQRCRLPKISAPKSLWINDLINVVCGSDICEPTFVSRTTCDGIDLEFDGACELFITIRYTRYAYTKSSLEVPGRCDPLLSSLIHRMNPYKQHFINGILEDDVETGIEGDKDSTICVHESDEFEDDDGCVYRVSSMNSTHVSAKCFYPRHENAMYGREKVFDLVLTKKLIQRRLD